MRPWWMRYYLQDELTEGEGGTGAAPSTTEGGEADSAEDDTSVNWGDMADDFEKDEVDEPVVEGDTEVGDAPAEPAPAPAAAPAPTPAPAAETPPVTPAAPAPSATPVAPAQTPEEYQAWRTNREAELAGSLYAINEADAQALLTEPETVLPRMAARMHMEVMESAMRAIQSVIPRMIEGYNQHERVNTQAKSLFTSINPDLGDPSYENAILELGQVYRKVNPTAPAEEAARAIGALVRSALGIAAPQAPGVTLPTAPAPVAQPAPFTPARGGGTGQVPRPSGNQFEALANEFLQDDM